MAKKRNVHGEGNYEASRQYNQRVKEFVESGRVDDAARQSAPRNREEAAEMQRAEQAAIHRSKDTRPPREEPPAPKPAVEEPPEASAEERDKAGQTKRPGKDSERP